MTQFAEAAKGFTDLPIAVLALVFAALAWKNGNKKAGAVFLFTGIGAIFGAVVHIFVLPPLIRKIVWTVLYVLLFESIRRFTVLFLGFIRPPKTVEKVLLIAAVSLYVVSLFFLYEIEANDILVLILFALICIAALIYSVIRYRYQNRYLVPFFGLAGSAALLQIPGDRFPIFVVLEHFCLFAALFIVYRMAKAENE